MKYSKCTTLFFPSVSNYYVRYKEIIDPNFEWKNFTIEEQRKVLLADRSNNYLDTLLLQSHYPNVPEIHQAVRVTLLEMKKNK